MKVLIIGSGGHARVVADILIAMEGIKPIGYASSGSEPGSTGPLGLPILGGDADIPTIEHDAVVVAIGDNAVRKRVFDELRASGENFVSAIHPTATIAGDAVVGQGCMICAGAIVITGAVIGDNAILNTGCTVDHDCRIAAHAHIAPGVNLAGTVTVGEGTFIGIGSSAIQEISIGEWVTAGAGSAIVSNVSAKSVIKGVPAK